MANNDHNWQYIRLCKKKLWTPQTSKSTADLTKIPLVDLFNGRLDAKTQNFRKLPLAATRNARFSVPLVSKVAEQTRSAHKTNGAYFQRTADGVISCHQQCASIQRTKSTTWRSPDNRQHSNTAPFLAMTSSMAWHRIQFERLSINPCQRYELRLRLTIGYGSSVLQQISPIDHGDWCWNLCPHQNDISDRSTKPTRENLTACMNWSFNDISTIFVVIPKKKNHFARSQDACS